MCTFGVSGCRVKPRRLRKKEIVAGEGKKKGRNFGPPTLRAPLFQGLACTLRASTLQGPTLRGPAFSRFGLAPFEPAPFEPPPFRAPPLHKRIGQKASGPKVVWTKSGLGQKRAKSGDLFGPFAWSKIGPKVVWAKSGICRLDILS